MHQGYEALTEKEKETLRLMVRGHDAKSMARELSLSVHTINDRLRVARRKLGVTSSREAARLVFEQEGPAPQNLADKELGGAEAGDHGNVSVVSEANGLRKRTHAIIGVLLMSAILAAILLATQAIAPESSPTTEGPPSEAPLAPNAKADAEVERAARDWLALVDAGYLEDAYQAAGASFRKDKTMEQWTGSVRSDRGPLGSVESRKVMEITFVEEDGEDYCGVILYTTFAGRGTIAELVTLKKEATGWRIHDYLVD